MVDPAYIDASTFLIITKQDSLTCMGIFDRPTPLPNKFGKSRRLLKAQNRNPSKAVSHIVDLVE